MSYKQLRQLTALAAYMLLAGCANQGPMESRGLSAKEAADVSSHQANASMGGAGAGAPASSAPQMAGKQMKMARADSPMTAQDSDQAAQVSKPAALKTDRYIIRNATLTVETKNALTAHDSLAALVKQVNGYMSALNEQVDGLGIRTIVVTARVPADKFDWLMSKTGSFGKILDRNVTTEDVTEEFVDTESNLRNLKRTESRLLEHLQKSGKLADTLTIERELTRIRSEIEQREGRLRFLGHRVDYSTFTFNLREAAQARPSAPPETYSTANEVSEATRSLVSFGRYVWTQLVWLGIWSVVWLPLLLITIVVLRWLWKAQRSQKEPKPDYEPRNPGPGGPAA